MATSLERFTSSMPASSESPIVRLLAVAFSGEPPDELTTDLLPIMAAAIHVLDQHAQFDIDDDSVAGLLSLPNSVSAKGSHDLVERLRLWNNDFSRSV